MANYKQEQSAAWLRSKGVSITNEYNEVPEIEFQEEFIVVSEDIVISKTPMGKVSTQLRNPSTQFDLLNPNTDEVIGSATYMEAYVLLYSLYRFLGNKRDIQMVKLKVLQAAKTAAENARVEYDKLAAAYMIAFNLSNASPSDDVKLATAESKLVERDAANTVLVSALLVQETAQVDYNATLDAA